MNDFAIIPAIDLKDGSVVHASGGNRSAVKVWEKQNAKRFDGMKRWTNSKAK